MKLFALSHPIDTEAHPDIPPGFRWAVYVTDEDWTSTRGCLGAGWAVESGQARFIADQAAEIARRAAGIGEETQTVVLDYDPIPKEAA